MLNKKNPAPAGPPKARSKGRGGSLTTTVTAIVVLAVLLIAGTTFAVATVAGERTARANVKSTVATGQAIQTLLQQQRFSRHKLISRIFASDQIFTTYITEAAQTSNATSIGNSLDSYQNLLDFDVAVVVDKSGVVINSTDRGQPGENLASTDLIAIAIKEGKASGVWQRRDQLFHALAVPLVRQYEQVGFIIVGFSINSTYATQIERASGADIVFLANGSSGPTMAAGTLDKNASTDLIAALRKSGGALDNAMNRAENVDEVLIELQGQRKMASLQPLRNAEGKSVGSTVVLASLDDQLAPFQGIRLQSLLAGIAALLLGGLLARQVVASTQKPLAALAQATEQAAQGNYEVVMPAAQGEPGRIADALGLLLGTVRERQAVQYVTSRLSRLLPEPAKAASAHAKPVTQRVALLAVEMRRFANPKLAYDPDDTVSRFGRDLQRVSTSAGSQKGYLAAVFGHRVMAVFEGENAAFRALTAATEVLLTLGERENVFDEPDPPVVALTVGPVITGTVIWGDHPAPSTAGLPVQQLESLLREATPGEIYFTRPFYDELAPQIQKAQVEVRAQRGLLSPQPLLLINGEAAAKLTGARTLSETRSAFAGDAKTLADLRAGTTVGARFELLAELGAGRMGVVFKALDRDMGDFVTLKMLRPEVVQDATQFERLKRAVARARGIRHPNVLSVIDFGEAEKIPYIESEFARGMTLAYMLEQAKALPTVAALRIARQVAWAIAAAHQQQLMHGCLKPENVLVESDGTVRVMDFGVGMPARQGMAIASPGYLAPEQLENREPDSRADFYAWGVMTYVALTGRLPYPGSTVEEIRQRMVSQDLPPARSVTADVPPALDAVLARALAKNPDQRYQTVLELIAELDAVKV
jgi:class 3 adenylate cyclase/tRNA A-37 threonylcarbamoyl transferase component Bud32